jgi:hypothetical protein
MASTKKSKKGAAVAEPEFGRKNYMILGGGIILIILGFIFLALGDITISPILLVLGYCVVIPLGILIPKEKEDAARIGVEKDQAISG